jgi:hypothetical protein
MMTGGAEAGIEAAGVWRGESDFADRDLLSTFRRLRFNVFAMKCLEILTVVAAAISKKRSRRTQCLPVVARDLQLNMGN